MNYDQILSIDIIEEKALEPTGKVILQAFTGSGLVAAIVSNHLIAKLGMVEKAYVKSKYIPAVGLVRNGIITQPVRIYENDSYILVLSEVSIPQDDLEEFIEALFEWYLSIDPASVVILGALPTGRKADATELRYSLVTSDEMTKYYLEEKGLWTTNQGAVYGTVALTLMEAAKSNMSSYAILPHCIATIPDYLAAKKLVELLSISLEERIEVSPLDVNANNLREHLIKKEKNRPKSSKYRDFPNIEELDEFMFDEDDEEDPSDFSKFV